MKYMENEGLVPSAEEEIKRRNVIFKLKEIVMVWAKRIAYLHRLPRSYIRAASATVVTYGSYGLGVHDQESDVDALCVGPGFATLAEDFFIVLRSMLECQPEISEIYCVKDAKVPLMRFKFNGVSVDLPYAKINAISVPHDVDVFNPVIFATMDEISWRSSSGVRANRSILRLVPDLKTYQPLLRCIKYWARRRGIYCNLFGFFGGIHLAILVAVICQRHPRTWPLALVSIFFRTFAFWPWPTPVILFHGGVPTDNIPLEKFFMPIQLPCSPLYCHSNITTSTFGRIRQEFLRGHHFTKDALSPNFDWEGLFEQFSYAYHYARFLKIRLSASNRHELGDWVGWVKSRIRFLLEKLEDLLGFCDPNPTEYIDATVHTPNTVFFWGLKIKRSHKIDIDKIEEDFLKKINSGRESRLGKIELSVVKGSELADMNKTSEPRLACGVSDGKGKYTSCLKLYGPSVAVLK
ncbi:poly(A) polymerase-like [Dorcoceras hygrometricum]|uniref:Poly(A) polymerase n=1 Tax=Dorcoceras hygrometricum TaxID=472368 RepID=A0A2Z7A6F7_9LAMI|nr:poly(A) polymerase-like [Dorcoceras hygrometricum]